MARLSPTPEQDAEVWSNFGGRCVCEGHDFGDEPKAPACSGQAVTIHEIVPKSQAPTTWTESSNRVAICEPCHWWVHNVKGTRAAAPLLRELAGRVIASRA